MRTILEIDLTERNRALFFARVDKRGPDECWPWTGAINRQGYGKVSSHGRWLRAPRVAWYLAHGEQPPAFVCHSCDNPLCCNPAHLWIGTSLDNNRDAVAKGRNIAAKRKAQTHCKRGHEYTAENTLLVLSSDGRMGRTCKICKRASGLKSWRKTGAQRRQNRILPSMTKLREVLG